MTLKEKLEGIGKTIERIALPVVLAGTLLYSACSKSKSVCYSLDINGDNVNDIISVEDGRKKCLINDNEKFVPVNLLRKDGTDFYVGDSWMYNPWGFAHKIEDSPKSLMTWRDMRDPTKIHCTTSEEFSAYQNSLSSRTGGN